MTNRTEREVLAERFEKKAKAGLKDVKFCLSNEGESTVEEICGEINRLYDAVEDGKAIKLDFNDSYLK